MDKKAKLIQGKVISSKMDKTRVVLIAKNLKHSAYFKSIKIKSKLFVHDEANLSKVGDVITAIKCRPISKLKSFKLHKVETQAL